METIKHLHWPLILGLGAIALVRPLANIMNISDYFSKGTVALTLTAAISLAWILIVGLSRVSHPVLVLVFSGLAYAVYSTLLSGVLSPILNGELQGPLATPIAIPAILIVNAVWGAVAGVLALVVQRLRGVRPGHPVTGQARR
ncbi:hypothetical protein [Arthrobacter castelli]|uniref:hypothetical protein n=1 Tax=Arthrobacter castelli TaxID=271431 RepID=UPI000414252D|nr:hypothetical protein [Arthrobacter castelli]